MIINKLNISNYSENLLFESLENLIIIVFNKLVIKAKIKYFVSKRRYLSGIGTIYSAPNQPIYPTRMFDEERSTIEKHK